VTAAIFPRYYLLGGTCGVIALLTSLLQWQRAPGRHRGLQIEMLLLLLMLAMTLYAGLGILPEASSLRSQLHAAEDSPGRQSAQRRFDDLHRRSVLLNGMVLLCGLGALAALSWRDPRLSGPA